MLFLAGVGLLWLNLRGLRAEDLAGALGSLNIGKAAVLMVLNLLILSLFALRWMLAQTSLGNRLSFGRFFAYRLAGFSISYLTPGPQFGGEPLQVALLHRRDGVPLAAASAGVGLDKIVELLANFSFLLFGLAASASLLPQENRAVAWIAAGLLTAIPLTLLGMLWRGKRPLAGLSGWLERHAARSAGLPIFHQMRLAEAQVGDLLRTSAVPFLRLLGVSLLAWILSVAEFYFLLHALGAGVTLFTVIALLTAMRFAYLLPIPGGLGVMETALVAAGQLVGLPPAVGIAAAVCIRLRDILLAALGLWIAGWSWRTSRQPRVYG